MVQVSFVVESTADLVGCSDQHDISGRREEWSVEQDGSGESSRSEVQFSEPTSDVRVGCVCVCA